MGVVVGRSVKGRDIIKASQLNRPTTTTIRLVDDIPVIEELKQLLLPPSTPFNQPSC